ncbi:EAL domain-containing protein (putative c-di-GMP-specific phosphodiesterase class I) [Actinoplanes tereljensis]|uniref:sensor domain-containing phosphodiesterase n=1 Tax=Paractinoplanes tereljensis TaxID=571912 RepID=UPI0019450234|nr:EAL domain-containing protein [Actinoplanes tereljensis]
MLDIHEVIDQRAVTTVFQPLVDLAGGGLLGFEALTRGPADTPLHTPDALFAAARAVGRETELDWVCRAVAFRTILAADPDPVLTWFVNMEPAASRVPCPADLAGAIEEARQRLRVVTEVTERSIAHDPAGLLAATTSVRAAGWGVALDDVGADPGSLALMPFIHPDVVKLDMQLLREPDEPHTARVVAAVSAYAEASGAVILAEGIETARHAELARTMGATVGQGWHHGRPGPLPAQVRAGSRLPFIKPPGLSIGTPFDIIGGRRPVTRTTKGRLMSMSRHLEALAGDGSEPPVLLACFQEERHFTAATAVRFTRIAANSPLVAALGTGLGDEPAPGVHGTAFGPADPLRGEWNVIVVGPHRAAALVARDVGDTGPDRERRFDFALTHDRSLVLEAARALLPWLAPAASGGLVSAAPSTFG